MVVGTHGRDGLERYVIGSVAERVVNTAPMPVLMVRATDDASTYPYESVLVRLNGIRVNCTRWTISGVPSFSSIPSTVFRLHS